MTLHPFQKICVAQGDHERPSILLAAAGPSIVTFDLTENTVLAEYSDVLSACDDADPEPHPAKRRKLDTAQPEPVSRTESEDSVEIVAERQKGERRKPKPTNDATPPNISHLITTTNGDHIVAVTVEDKLIHVLSHSSGRLMLRSSRSMPKRLCSITLTPDEQTIIAADKFGDVYSLPLLPSANFTTKTKEPNPRNTFEPSASETTVHTKGNLEALRQQRNQKKFKAPKEGLDFEHKLLLGHVSLLTDAVIGEARIDGRTRQFLLTADRDEHIRVSRYPQAHIIEGYCLGHREFVSKLCVIPWDSRLLLSGGGEPSLKLWDWRNGKLLHEVSFASPDFVKDIAKFIDEEEGREVAKMAVSGIWAMPDMFGANGRILVTLEAMPVLFDFAVSDTDELVLQDAYMAQRNILDLAFDVAADTKSRRLILTLDNYHESGSVTSLAEGTEDGMPFDILSMQLLTWVGTDDDPDAVEQQLQWNADDSKGLNENAVTALKECIEADSVNSTVDGAQKKQRGERGKLSEFLYGLENLRKKRMSAAEEDQDDEAEVEDGPHP